MFSSDDEAFSTVNDAEGSEGWGVVNPDEEQEADQGSADIFASFADALASAEDNDDFSGAEDDEF